jgi:hypothetical protein
VTLELTPIVPGHLELTPSPRGHLGLSSLMPSSPYVNVRDHGAVGDGVADEASAISAAISAGGITFFPAGSYLVRSKIEIDRDNVVIVGGGRATIIQLADGVGLNLIRVNTSGDITGNTRLSSFQMSNLTLDHGSQSGEDPALAGNLAIFCVDDVALSDVWVLNSRDVGVNICNCNRVRLARIVVDGLVSGGGSQQGINVFGGTPTTGEPFGDYQLDQCWVSGADNGGIFVDGCNARRGSVTNCVVRGTSSSISHGILTEVGPSPSADLTISNNVVEGCGDIGIGIVNSSGKAVPWHANVSVTGNIVRNCLYGMSFCDAAITATGNVITDVAVGISVGTALDYPERDFLIAGNVINLRAGALGAGITVNKSVASGTFTLDRVTIQGNLIVGDVPPPPCRADLVSDSTANQVDAGAHVYAVTFLTSAGETQPSAISPTVTPTAPAGGYTQVMVENIPIGPSNVTGRKLYRTAAGSATLKLLTTISDNTTTTYPDTKPDASLGATAPTVSVNVSSDGVLIDSRVRYVQVLDNTIAKMGRNAVHLQNSNGGSPSEVTIEGNRMYDNGQAGVGGGYQSAVQIDTACDRIRVLHNRGYDTGAGTQQIGVSNFGSPTNLTIYGNDFTGTTMWLSLGGGATGYKQDATIAGQLTLSAI